MPTRNNKSLLDTTTIATQRNLLRPFDVLLLVRRAGYVSLFQIIHEEMIPVPRALVMQVEHFQSHFCSWAPLERDPGDRQLYREMLIRGGRRTEILDLPKPAPKRTGTVNHFIT